MAAVVSTRILRLQAISPRVSSVNIPSSLVPVSIASVQGVGGSPDSTKIALYWNASANQFEIWKDADFKIVPSGTLIFTITVPSLSINSIVPGVSVATGNVAGGIFSATPPSQSLDSAIPGISALATSP